MVGFHGDFTKYSGLGVPVEVQDDGSGRGPTPWKDAAPPLEARPARRDDGHRGGVRRHRDPRSPRRPPLADAHLLRRGLLDRLAPPTWPRLRRPPARGARAGG